MLFHVHLHASVVSDSQKISAKSSRDHKMISFWSEYCCLFSHSHPLSYLCGDWDWFRRRWTKGLGHNWIEATDVLCGLISAVVTASVTAHGIGLEQWASWEFVESRRRRKLLKLGMVKSSLSPGTTEQTSVRKGDEKHLCGNHLYDLPLQL